MTAANPNLRSPGRKKGLPNKATRELKDIARSYAPEAIEIAARIMRNGKCPAASRISAANLILDRGYGKAPQPMVGGGVDSPPIRHRHEITDADRLKALTMLIEKTREPK